MATNATTGVDDRYSDDGGSVINTRVDQMVNWLLNWGRSNSVWYLLFGLACCAIELMQTGGPRADLERFGSAPRPSPRSSDLIIVAGTLTYKMALRVKRLFDQMSEPRYVISMGSCSNCGGLFQYAYSVCKGVDQIIPVDVYVPGCPPRPEALLEGLLKIQEKVRGMKDYTKTQPIHVPIPTRTGYTLLPDELSDMEKANKFAMRTKERATPT